MSIIPKNLFWLFVGKQRTKTHQLDELQNPQMLF